MTGRACLKAHAAVAVVFVLLLAGSAGGRHRAGGYLLVCQQLLAALAARLGQVRQLLRLRCYEVVNSRPSTGVRTSAERRQRPDNILLRSHLPRHLVDDLQQCHHAERQLQEQPQDLSRVTAPQCCQPSVCTRCGRYIDDSDACGRQLGVAGMPERPAASCSVKVVGPHTRLICTA